MEKKLSKLGNSKALVLDKTILKLLNIKNDMVEMKIVGNTLVISSVQRGKKKTISKDEKIQKAYEKVVERYSNTLKKLAE